MYNCWNVLGVIPGSSKQDIKSAYRKLAKQNHADVGGSDERMREIIEAYKLAMKLSTNRIGTENNIIIRIKEKMIEIENKGDYNWLKRLSFHKGYNSPEDYLYYLSINYSNGVYRIDHELEEFKRRETKFNPTLLGVYNALSKVKRRVTKKVGEIF